MCACMYYVCVCVYVCVVCVCLTTGPVLCSALVFWWGGKRGEGDWGEGGREVERETLREIGRAHV